MALLKSGLGTLMDWQKHRAELRTSYPTSAEVERAEASEQNLPTIVVVDMQRAAGMPLDGTKEQELIRAVQILSGFPLVRLQADVTPPQQAAIRRRTDGRSSFDALRARLPGSRDRAIWASSNAARVSTFFEGSRTVIAAAA
ncbi:hypothetical protein AB0C47_13620 [Micromonospora taraxaci]|uniref:hypothetical protein n=1 Tax=Micromonospora taraxaci TaxID=1316803 RepID=UPI0033FA309A